MSTLELQQSNGNEFTCDISEKIVEQIMKLTNVADNWKILLLMGIGVFKENHCREHPHGKVNHILENKFHDNVN